MSNFISICSLTSLFSRILSILLRFYLNSFFSLFSEFNLPSSQLVICGQETLGICLDLMYDFCRDADVLYCEKMFCLLKQGKNFKSLYYEINYSKYFESSNGTIFIEDD